MTDQSTPPPQPETPPPAGAPSGTSESWQEVGKQFETLGASLAAAFRATWTDEENRRRLQAMQGGLESMMREISSAIHTAAASPEGQRAREEVTRAAGSARAAGEKAMQEARPHILAALQQVNAELQRLIARVEAPPAPEAPEAPAAPSPEPPAAPPTEPAPEKKWYEGG